MTNPRVVKPKIRCTWCSIWYEPEWRYHAAHKVGYEDCVGLVTGGLFLSQEHMVSYCKCGKKSIRPLQSGDPSET